jgi:hypothetical protein
MPLGMHMIPRGTAIWFPPVSRPLAYRTRRRTPSRDSDPERVRGRREMERWADRPWDLNRLTPSGEIPVQHSLATVTASTLHRLIAHSPDSVRKCRQNCTRCLHIALAFDVALHLRGHDQNFVGIGHRY